MTITVHEAKTQFSRLLARVMSGEEIVIAKAGKREARLCPLEPAKTERRPGLDRGLCTVPDDFDQPLPESVREDFHR